MALKGVNLIIRIYIHKDALLFITITMQDGDKKFAVSDVNRRWACLVVIKDVRMLGQFALGPHNGP